MAFTSKNYKVNEGRAISSFPASLASGNAVNLVQNQLTASIAVKKGQLVIPTGAYTIGPAGAKALNVIGVAMFDAAIDEKAVVETAGLVNLTSAGVVTAGDRIVCAAEGKAAAFADTGRIVGIALNTTTDADQDVFCVLSL